jgi:hypothetical protein
MNDRIIRPRNDTSAMLAVRFTDAGPTAVTANMLIEEAKANFRKGLGGFLRVRDATPEELPARSYDDKVKGIHFARDMMGGGTNVARQKPGLNTQRLMFEFGVLKNMGIFSPSTMFNVHDDATVGVVADELEKAICDVPNIMHLRGAARDQAIEIHVRQFADAAPNLFTFLELIKQSERVIEQRFTQLYARGLFPVANLNTWLETWMFRRRGDTDAQPAQPIDLSGTNKRSSRNNGEQTVPVARPLRAYSEGASWNQMELWRMAEAVANGMPTWNIVDSRTKKAIRSLMLAENNLAFFGDPAAIANGIVGLLSPQAQTGIVHTNASTKFGAGSPETDRVTLIEATSSILLQTEREYQPDTLAVGTATWLYITETRYGSLANPSDKLVIDVAMDTLRMRGVNEISWIPELGYRPDVKAKYVAQGLDATESERLAGGIATKHAMATFRKDADVVELVVGKDVIPYPSQSEVLGETEARYALSSGGLAIYQPAAMRITTDVGPDA